MTVVSGKVIKIKEGGLRGLLHFVFDRHIRAGADGLIQAATIPSQLQGAFREGEKLSCEVYAFHKRMGAFDDLERDEFPFNTRAYVKERC